MNGLLGELHELDKSVYSNWLRILDLLFIPSILLARFQTSAWSTPRSIPHPKSPQNIMDERKWKMLENKKDIGDAIYTIAIAKACLAFFLREAYPLRPVLF